MNGQTFDCARNFLYVKPLKQFPCPCRDVACNVSEMPSMDYRDVARYASTGGWGNTDLRLVVFRDGTV